MHRAYSVLTVKAVDSGKRQIRGTATTPSVDRMGDVVEPLGVTFGKTVPLLLHHDSRQPVGTVRFETPTEDGIDFVATLPQIDEPPALKDRIDTAFASVDAGLIRGASIGFRAIEEAYNKDTGGYRFLKTEILEVSLVTVPANADCTIATLKQFDSAALGRGGHLSGASDVPRTVKQLRPDRSMPRKTYADQIASWEATRAAKTARMDELLTKSGEAGVTLDAAEKEEHDTLDAEVVEIDAQLARLRAAEKREKELAAPVPVTGLQLRAGARIQVERKLPPGILFARYAMCMGASHGNEFEAQMLAKKHYPDDPGIVTLIEKAAVGAAATLTPGWAQELVPYNIMDDFIEFLRPRTILGKFGTNGIPALNMVPFNVRVSGFSTGLTANWVGEGLPALVSKATSFTMLLTWAKIAALAVLTKEEIRFSNPAAEAKVRDDIARAVIYRQDHDFMDPAKAAVVNVSPAGILFGTAPIAPSGTTAGAARTDFATLLATFATLMLDPSDIVIVMSTLSALNLSLMLNPLGAPQFPGLTMAGGNFLGFPVITSEALTALGSPAQDIIAAIKASDVYVADDGTVTIDASDQASVEMTNASAQSGITGTGAQQVSFWQTGLVGLKATRAITWQLRRQGAARYIGPVAYRA